MDSSEREDTSSVEGGTPKLEGEKSLGESRGISIDVTDELDRTSASAMEAKADKESQERALALRERLGDADALTKWDVFTFSKLKAILDHQMVGSYEVPAPELSLNQVSNMCYVMCASRYSLTLSFITCYTARGPFQGCFSGGNGSL